MHKYNLNERQLSHLPFVLVDQISSPIQEEVQLSCQQTGSRIQSDLCCVDSWKVYCICTNTQEVTLAGKHTVEKWLVFV